MELLQDVLKVAAPQEKIELTILHNAVIETAKAYKSDPNSTRLKDWKAAKAALEEELMSTADKYGVEKEEDRNEIILPPFKKKIDVLAYLQREGWLVSKTAFYDHCKDGLLRPAKKTGQYEKKDIDRYAKKNLRLQETGQKLDADREERIRRKEEAEIRKIEAQAAKAEREEEVLAGKYVPKEDVELELAGRAAVLDSGIRTLIQSQAPAWIELANGDQARIADLIEAMSNNFAGLLNEYATTERFHVVLKQETGINKEKKWA